MPYLEGRWSVRPRRCRVPDHLQFEARGITKEILFMFQAYPLPLASHCFPLAGYRIQSGYGRLRLAHRKMTKSSSLYPQRFAPDRLMTHIEATHELAITGSTAP